MWVNIHMRKYSELVTSHGLWGSSPMVTKSSVEHMSELKIRIETEEWVYEEYVEA